jgi:hypothetical protein
MSARALVLAAAGALFVAAAVADASARRPAAAGLTISGRASGRLVPGGALPIDLRLTNRRPYALRVRALTVAVRAASRRGCAARANFATLPYRGRPVVLPARATRTLAALRIRRALWPRIVMRDRAVSQDACAGARLTLRYAGVAGRTR